MNYYSVIIKRNIILLFVLQVTFIISSITKVRPYRTFQSTYFGVSLVCYMIGHLFELRSHTAINRADFVSWWMWFNGSPTKVQRHECILLPSYLYNMHQDTKSARLIAVCKRTFSA